MHHDAYSTLVAEGTSNNKAKYVPEWNKVSAHDVKKKPVPHRHQE